MEVMTPPSPPLSPAGEMGLLRLFKHIIETFLPDIRQDQGFIRYTVIGQYVF
ncbi:hypothetical protein KDA_14960 [Dictyobacter alpinus]|uniref:Uncharacterized protein n=1 Tax=Dictyobacter alpinus TaxID=2014873 RepID=A0A402B3U6_9CHLR|nr:hypothetical protein KDA_14960 [Dictyobacter alpinus]